MINQYLRAHPDAREVLEYIRACPSGVTSEDVRGEFPHMSSGDRASITRNLHDWGYIRRADGDRNRLAVWVAT